MWVGAPTTAALVGNKIAPGLPDRYLAQTGYDAQQTDEPETPGRPDNLWSSTPEDRGAYGDYDHQARDRSVQLWLSTHRPALAALTTIACGLVGGLLVAPRLP